MPDTVDAQEFTEANRAFFDDRASRYNAEPWQRKMSAKIKAEIRAKAAFIGVTPKQDRVGGKEVRLLDYACGTGLVSLALAPYITHTTGLDISTSMIAAFKTALTPAASASNNSKEETTEIIPHTAHVANLLSTPPTPTDLLSDPAFHDFDIVAVGLGFHHFDDPGLAVQRLAGRLRVGGVLVVVDFVAGEGEGDSHGHGHGDSHGHGHSHGHDQSDPSSDKAKAWTNAPGTHTIRTHGFTRAGTQALFDAAGLVEFGWSEVDELVEMRFPRRNSLVGAGVGVGVGAGQDGVGNGKGKDGASDGKAEAEETVVWRRVFLARGTKGS